MALLLTCPPCAEGRCEDHIPHSGAAALIGGVSCPCKHTDAERQAERERFQRSMDEMFGGEADQESV